MTDPQALFTELAEEGAELDGLVAEVSEQQWRSMSAAPGWTVAHQIAHLAWTDEIATLAATDAEGFARRIQEALENPVDYVTEAAEKLAASPRAELLTRWRAGRAALVNTLRAVPAGQKLPWFGPPMAAPSMATARIMETWAHGQDVVDGLGFDRKPTNRLRNVAHIGTRTVGFAFTLHNLPVPSEPFRFELTGPEGDLWTWGEPDAANRVSAPALDFCLLVTQRRHPDDLAIEVRGEQARQWVPIAQAFAGMPGEGRKAGQFQ